MSNFKIKRPSQSPIKTDWFYHEEIDVIYKRGVDGIVIHSDGRMATGLPYGGDTMKVFDDSTIYEPLPPGTEITFIV